MASREMVTAPWRFVGVDPAFGEFEKPVLVVPELSVRVAPAGVTWPQSQPGSRTVTVVVRSEAEDGSLGEVAIAPMISRTPVPELPQSIT